MKVGIITLLGNNYGGMLQAYALNRKLKELNKDTININYLVKSSKMNLKDMIKKAVYHSRNKKFKKFRREFLNLTEKIKDSSMLKEEKWKCDAYIAGSDQIWNQQIPLEERKIFFLDFVKKAKKISYAASIGRDTIEEQEKQQISQLLDRFDAISIRENTGVKLYQPLTKNKIENVLDPTLLLNCNEWDEIAKTPNIKKDYIFSYTLGADRNILDNIDSISEKLNIGITEIYYKKNFKNEITNINDAGPKEFVGLIKNAKYVVTNSFHGMVFSILYKKDFWVFTRGKMNSRIYDLLEILDLKDRIIESDTNINEIDLNSKIDYNKVYQQLEKERKKSIDFLKNALA